MLLLEIVWWVMLMFLPHKSNKHKEILKRTRITTNYKQRRHLITPACSGKINYMVKIALGIIATQVPLPKFRKL